MGQDYLSLGGGEARLTKQQMLALGYFAVFRKSLKSLVGYSLPKHELADRLPVDGVLLVAIYWGELHGGVCGPFALHGPLKVFFVEERAAFMAWQDGMGYDLSAKKGSKDSLEDYRPAVERWFGGNKPGSPRSVWFKAAIKLRRHRRLLSDVRKQLPKNKPRQELPSGGVDDGMADAPLPATKGNGDDGATACGCFFVVLVGLGLWWFFRQ